VNKFFQVQAAARAKQLRPDTYTVVRHHMDEQTQLAYLGMADKRAAADGIFRRFIDGTFAQHAEFVDAVEFTNEMWGPNRRDEVEALDIAGIRVWTEVYQAQQIFEHIRCVFGNAAVGNNTTTAVAREVAEKGQILGYHPYIPVKLGVPLPREISHYSLRWMALDDMYKQNDIYVDWFFGEIGAVGYCSSSSGGDDGNGRVGRFEPGWGWQHPDVCNGDLANYLKILDSWAAYVMAWNHKNDNRALGGTIFSSGPGWPYFQIRQPVMNQVADHYKQFFANIPEPKPEPEPEPEEKAFGIDVSHWQGEMDWARAKAQGVQFAFIKATEGTGHTDSQFFRNWTEVGKQGILRAPYHFYLSRMDPITQADYAASRYPSNAELPLVVDIEDNKEVPADIANRVLVFLKKVEELTGRRPIIYTAAWWWNPNMGSPEWAAGYHLWAAVWTGNPNPSPASLPSGFAGWKFWQYTSQGDGQRYGAQSATLDLNRFNGDAKALQEYADGYVIPEPEPVEAYWKIGWHAGVGGNRNNIGQYMSRLDAAGIPFCVKSVNDGGLVEEAAGIARSSGVKHSIIFRLTNPGGAPHDKPDFNKTPEAAAVQHWSLVRNNLPPEVARTSSGSSRPTKSTPTPRPPGSAGSCITWR
jgi:GH25 family lysozyme M1 (1,4-beta-N-acetylmuramidase)